MNFQPLRDFLDYYLPMIGVPGSDTVIYMDHEEIFRHTAGFNSLSLRTPMRKDLIYNIYSCSKLATAVAALQLIERGELVVTDPVYAYLPEFKNLTVKVKDSAGNVIGTRPAEKTMLISHLLTMTSGMNYDTHSKSIEQEIAATEGRAPTVEVCRAMAKEPLEFEPGDDYYYSLSLDIMAAVVEVVSGQRFSDYMAENVFLPLGMKDTGYHPDPTKRDRFATQYAYDKMTHRVTEIPFEQCHCRFGADYDCGGGGIVSTVDDYILLVDALANGGVAKNGNRILCSRSVELMRANALNPKQNATFATQWNSGYGYGYAVRTNIDPFPSGNLTPKGAFGWDGYRLCVAHSDPENRLAMFHAEHMGGLHGVVIPRLRNLIYSCLDI